MDVHDDAKNEKYAQRILDNDIPGRQEALRREQGAVNGYGKTHNGAGPEGNKLPTPKPDE